MSYRIFTDSCADLDKAKREELDIDYVAMSISVNDRIYRASLDWEEYSPAEFYGWMREGTRVFTTQVSAEEFEEKFSPCLDAGDDIIYIGCSSALSGSVVLAKKIADDLCKKYPERKIAVIDALTSSLGEGYMAIKAAEMKKSGASFDEVVSYIEENKLCVNQAGTVESLEYLKRAGRVKAPKAFFGNLFAVKPIIISDAKGNNFAYRQVKGRRTSLRELVREIKENGIGLEDQIIYISHADAEEDAEFVKSEIVTEGIVCRGVYTNYIGPIVGASVGPGTIIVFCVGKKVEITGE